MRACTNCCLPAAPDAPTCGDPACLAMHEARMRQRRDALALLESLLRRADESSPELVPTRTARNHAREMRAHELAGLQSLGVTPTQAALLYLLSGDQRSAAALLAEQLRSGAQRTMRADDPPELETTEHPMPYAYSDERGRVTFAFNAWTSARPINVRVAVDLVGALPLPTLPLGAGRELSGVVVERMVIGVEEQLDAPMPLAELETFLARRRVMWQPGMQLLLTLAACPPNMEIYPSIGVQSQVWRAR